LPAELDLTELADRIRSHFDDGCYACGRTNPIGLRVDGFRQIGDDLIAEFTPRTEHRGGPGVLHGGIAATVMDEILAWAGMVSERLVVVTATLELRYRKPVTIGDEPLMLKGRLDDRNGRRLRLSGSLISQGVEAVTATGLYIAMHDLDELLAEAT
jgi:acyl-coenzyme A thioesterase PaaI-like protein